MLRLPAPLQALALVAVAGAILTAAQTGCVTAPNSFYTPGELAQLGAVPPGAELAPLRRGRALAITECAECHRLYHPNEYPPRAWRGIAESMGRRASLSQDDIAALQAYLTVAAAHARAGNGAPAKPAPAP